MRDHASSMVVRTAVAPAVFTDNTAIVGTVIDRLGFEGLTYLIVTGTLADADATFAVLLEESEQAGSGFTPVADKDLIGTETAAGFTFADDNTTRKLGYIGNKRYTRLTITPTGNTGNASVTALAYLSGAHALPVAA